MIKPEDVPAFPLRWPDGWPKTQPGRRNDGGRFKVAGDPIPNGTYRPMRMITYHRARRLLKEELDRLGAKNVVISSNVRVRNDGEPVSGATERAFDEPGVAIYFTLKGKPLVMAQDAFIQIAANVRSLGLAIDALRSLERHGGGTMMQRAFDGFTALPAPDGKRPKRPWWIVLNYGDAEDARLDLSVEEVEARFRTLAKRRHPDVDGGSIEAMTELNEARDDAVRELGG